MTEPIANLSSFIRLTYSLLVLVPSL